MHIVTTINDWQAIRRGLTRETIGFIPTMGHLHEGHLSLCRQSKNENDLTILSIFVNPMQFNHANDFEHYPRNITQDTAYLENTVDYLFLPDSTTMYPDQYQIQVMETELTQELEGKYRPGHFTGMLTIVLKLLNLIQPSRAYFGEKDYQQLLLVKKMVSALFLPIDVIGCPTVRASDGLALSSRNSRLTPAQREKAAHFPRLLQSRLTPEEIICQLAALDCKVDYIVEQWQRRLGAIWIDDIRLIDNVSLRKK
jgi:pantoate--beta-alanine ligase